jgi:hypothetical protein
MKTYDSSLVSMPASDRFWRRVEKTPGCWIWTGSRTRDGYGQFTSARICVGAHRYSYESLRGPIPPGMQLDHLCRTRECVRPDHMEPVTQAENTRRKQNFSHQAGFAL